MKDKVMMEQLKFEAGKVEPQRNILKEIKESDYYKTEKYMEKEFKQETAKPVKIKKRKNRRNILIAALSGVFAIAITFGILALTGVIFSNTKPTEGLQYSLLPDKNAYEVSIGTATDKNIVIASEHEGKPVTQIANDGFMGSDIKSITMPDSITVIGDGFDDGIIQYGAFWGCMDLINIVISENITIIGDYAFYECYNLKSVEISNGVKRIGDCAFTSCRGLTSITIPDSVTSIGDYAFNTCDSLTSIRIPDSLVNLGKAAFSGCARLTNITVGSENPNYSAEGGVLYNKNKTTLIAYPVVRKTIIIPDSVTIIGNYAFFASGVFDVKFPDSLISIEDHAFLLCGLTSITIPDSVSSIGDAAFAGCNSLKNITVMSENPNYSAEGGALYNKNKTTLIAYPAASGTITIPDSVTNIGDYAFLYCFSLTGIIIPDSVTSIGDFAFFSCGLESVTIPDSVTSIGDSAFEACARLKNITIPNSITSIGDSAFAHCESLENITIPNSVTSIGDHAFYYCQNLTSITIPNSVTSIGEYAFFGCKNLKSITIPNSVTSIEEYAFFGCQNLVSIIIPNSVTSIGDYAFYGCENLKSITIPNSVTSIGYSTFDRFNYLTLYFEMESISEKLLADLRDLSDFSIILDCTLSEDKTYVVSFIKTSSSGNQISAPYRYGYTFGGWATTENGPKVYDAEYINDAPYGTVLYAIWILNS